MNRGIKFYILLSTYNGEGFLESLLESLCSQTYDNYEILVRDDLSTDGTVHIIEQFRVQRPRQVIPCHDNLGNIGPQKSFTKLLKIAVERSRSMPLDQPYYLFADQDDIWLKDKLKSIYIVLNTIDAQVPLLLHHDLSLVDNKLQSIEDSFYSYQGLNPKKNRLIHLAVVNNVVGCTMVMNQLLAKHCTQQPSTAIMHDWWVAMVASLTGRIIYLPEKLVLYRQHGKNVCGALAVDSLIVKMGFRKKGFGIKREYYLTVSQQAFAFKRRFKDNMNMGESLFFSLLIRLPSFPFPIMVIALAIIKICYHSFGCRCYDR